MTSNDVFLGGGSSSGSYNRQSLPNITGKEYPASVIDDITNGGRVEFGGSYFPANEKAAKETEKLSTGAFRKRTISSGDVWYELRQYLSFDVGTIYFSSSSATLSSQFGVVNEFDASRSNSIYRNGSNVRPNYYTIEFWIKFK